MTKNLGSKKKNRTQAYKEREYERMRKEYVEMIRKRQLESAIDKGDIPTAASLMAYEYRR